MELDEGDSSAWDVSATWEAAKALLSSPLWSFRSRASFTWSLDM